MDPETIWRGERRPPPARLAYCPLLHQESRRQLGRVGQVEDRFVRKLCDAGFDCASCNLFWSYIHGHVRDYNLIRWLCPTCARDYRALGFYAIATESEDGSLQERQCECCQEWFPILIACQKESE